jgi:hypothetical protein
MPIEPQPSVEQFRQELKKRSKEGVKSIVPKVAQLVQKYGRPFLEDDAAFYTELEKANERLQ